MATAILNGELIAYLTVQPGVGVEVGDIPEKVALQRLRWDGYKLVDLNELDEFYVDRSSFQLFINHKPNTELVKMNYKDRNKLTIDKTSGKIRTKTIEEINQPKHDEYKARRRTEYPSIGDQLDVLWKFISTLKEKSPEVIELIDKIEEIKEKYPEPKIVEDIRKLKL